MPDDLDDLISQLNNVAQPTPSRLEASGSLVGWLELVREIDGSDLLLVAGSKPVIRARGKLTPAADSLLDGDDIEAAVAPVVASATLGRYRSGEAVDVASPSPISAASG